MYRIRRSHDLDLVRKLHDRLFPEDAWVGDDHAFWVVYDNDNLPVGFCSAVHRPDMGYVFLSRSGVDTSVRGSGLQRRMIRVRVQWARKLGARDVITYTLLHNHPSFVNLLRCGFRFYRHDPLYAGEDVHYLKLELAP